MNLLFYLSIAEIERKVNALYGEVLFDGTLEEVGARVRIRRKGGIHISHEGQGIRVKIPVQVYAKITWKEQLLGIWDVYTPTFEETDFEITVQYDVIPETDSTWDLKTHTHSSFTWDKKPKIDLGPVKMGVTTLLKPLIMGEITKVAGKIDSFIIQQVALHKRVREGWEEMQGPKRVSEDPPVWLVIQPGQSSLFTTGVQVSTSKVMTRISLPVEIRAVLGDKPEVGAPKTLPPFSHVQETETALDTEVLTELPYRTFSQLFTGKTLHVGTLELYVRGLGLKFRDGKLNVSLSLAVTSRWGPLRRRFRVVMFATCVPYLDRALGKIRIKEVDYAFLTADLTFRFLSRFFRKWLIRKLTLAVNTFVEETDHLVIHHIKESLKGTEFGKFLTLEGVISDYRHEALQMTPHYIEVQTRVKGALAFAIKLRK